MKHALKFAAVAILALTVSGCTSAQSADAQHAQQESAGSQYSPVTIDNCGTTVSFDHPPERVLALKSTSIEMLLALDQQDRIAGIAYQDGPFADTWADRGADLPVIDERVPSSEAALKIEPDFIYAGWESMLTDKSIGARDSLADIGVNSYVSPAACQGEGYRPEAVTFDLVYSEIRQMGAIFDAGDQAESVIADLQNRLAATKPDDRRLSALWYSSGSDIPFVGAGTGAPQMVMDAAGLRNVASDVDGSWVSMGWESILDADPDVIVLVDSSWNTAQYKISQLEQYAPTLSAVVNHRYLVVPFATTEAGVRSVEAVETLQSQLAALTMTPASGASAS